MAVPKLAQHTPERSFDQRRGIQNVERVGRSGVSGKSANDQQYDLSGIKPSKFEQYGEAANDRVFSTEDHSVGKSFENEESITARAYRTKKQQHALSLEEDQALLLADSTRRELIRNHAMEVAQAAFRAQATQKAMRMSSVRVLSPFRIWMGIGAVSTACFWISVCGIISLIGFGFAAVVSDFFANTALGTAIKWTTSFFFDVESLFPAEYLGWGFYIVATIISIGTSLVFLLFFWFNDMKFMDSTGATLVTFGCIICSLLPVTNIFPWLLIWVIYINVRTMKSFLSSSLFSFR